MEMEIWHRSCCDVNSFISADLFMSTERVFYAACSMQHTHMSHATDSSRRKGGVGRDFLCAVALSLATWSEIDWKQKQSWCFSFPPSLIAITRQQQQIYCTVLAGRPGVDYPILSAIPYTNFYCDEQSYPGFFADMETRCQGKFIRH